MTESIPPQYDAIKHLRASTLLASTHCAANVLALCTGLGLSVSSSILGYIAGQVVLTLCLVHAFVLLHEAGHQTLFKNRQLNTIAGHYASTLSLIPFASWRPIHARHHRYTGWQDLDATTATLVPRPLKHWESQVINFAWRSGTPLFSIMYRIQNYWHVPRIHRFVKNHRLTMRIAANAILLFAVYCLIIVVFGGKAVIIAVGPAILLSLAAEDILLLSQHSHIPQNLSKGEAVQTFPPLEQAQFSRSLRLPPWLSKALMHFDAHELHHMYPQVPGYHLNAINYQPPNEVHWSAWVPEAKKLSGVDFLFRNRNDTDSSV